jgi:hypothetical protein
MGNKNFSKLLPMYFGGMLLLHLAIAWPARNLVAEGYPDFSIFYAAGKIIDRGLGQHLYERATQFQIQQEFAAGVRIRQGPLPYNHPPFEALLFIPFSRAPYVLAYVLWNSLNLLLLVALPLLLRRTIPILSHEPPVYWAFACLGILPVFVAILQGQDIILLVLLFALTFVALKNGHEFAAGAWLGLGLFRFHLVLPMLLVLLLQKRRKTGAGFLIVAMVLGLVSLAVVGWRGIVSYPKYVWEVEKILGKAALSSSDMPCIRGLLDAITGTRIPHLSAMCMVAVASVALVLWVLRSWKPTGDSLDFDIGFSLCVVMTVLVSYHSFIYDLSLLLLPVAIVVSHFSEVRQCDLWTRIALLAPLCVLLFSPLQMVLALTYYRVGLLAIPLLFWMWGMVRMVSKKPASISAEPSGSAWKPFGLRKGLT